MQAGRLRSRDLLNYFPLVTIDYITPGYLCTILIRIPDPFLYHLIP